MRIGLGGRGKRKSNKVNFAHGLKDGPTVKSLLAFAEYSSSDTSVTSYHCL